MEIFSAEHLYKIETGEVPGHVVELEFGIWRSKGQWIINISDEEKMRLFGNRGIIEITLPDEDYIRWLEEKVMESIK
jgi:hypothetical protein